jgi:hypothetical protein
VERIFLSFEWKTLPRGVPCRFRNASAGFLEG